MLCNFNLDDVSQVESIIGRSADVKQLVNTKFNYGSNLLYYAAQNGRFYQSFFPNEMHSKSVQFVFSGRL